MADADSVFLENEHQGAFIFEPGEPGIRTPKRRKTSKKKSYKLSDTDILVNSTHGSSAFVTLLAGREDDRWRYLRQQLFAASWSKISSDIQCILRQANQSTIDAVTEFVRMEVEAEINPTASTIPAAFVLTGPNIASQNLLFDQLDEILNSGSSSKCVRLRSTDAVNLKTTLKKIVRDATSQSSGFNDDDNDPELALSYSGRRFLDYDLEALFTYVELNKIRQVVIALQDSEAFDTALIADLVMLFKSWAKRIPIVIVFGVATSVDLFQSRLSRTTCQSLIGEQFDVAQSSHVLEGVFKVAVASASVPLRLGPSLLNIMLERQRDHVAGIHVFASSIKYAYMCHFYANPLSILLADLDKFSEKDLQPEHLEAIRELPSFKEHIEKLVDKRQLDKARMLLTDNAELATYSMQQMAYAKEWITRATQSLALFAACSFRDQDFTTEYLEALTDGFLMDENSEFTDSIKKMSADDVSVLLKNVIRILTDGDEVLGLSGWAGEDSKLLMAFRSLSANLESLQDESHTNGTPLKSKYGAQSRVMRTTIIAQRVQLSQDVSMLTSQDKSYTQLVERLSDILVEAISCPPPGEMFLREAWLFDAKSPYRSVFIPRPGSVMDRALAQPQDYLACSCCRLQTGDLNMATAPAISVLYHLYMDAGPLVNVADLWTAFYALVGRMEPDAQGKGGRDGLEEREALVLFYRGLSELRAMGYVKPTKKKVDHIAKVRHFG